MNTGGILVNLDITGYPGYLDYTGFLCFTGFLNFIGFLGLTGLARIVFIAFPGSITANY